MNGRIAFIPFAAMLSISLPFARQAPGQRLTASGKVGHQLPLTTGRGIFGLIPKQSDVANPHKLPASPGKQEVRDRPPRFL